MRVGGDDVSAFTPSAPSDAKRKAGTDTSYPRASHLYILQKHPACSMEFQTYPEHTTPHNVFLFLLLSQKKQELRVPSQILAADFSPLFPGERGIWVGQGSLPLYSCACN